MIVLGLDIATRTGFAIGAPGEVPRSGAVRLKQHGEERGLALSNCIVFLQRKLSAEKPTLVIKEAPLALGGFGKVRNSQDTVKMTLGLHGIVEAMCVRFGVRLEEVAPATVRKHFIGQANMGERKKTKAAVIQRCHVLGYLPRDCFDTDRADAVAVWSWAECTFGKTVPAALHMFGEVPLFGERAGS